MSSRIHSPLALFFPHRRTEQNQTISRFGKRGTRSLGAEAAAGSAAQLPWCQGFGRDRSSSPFPLQVLVARDALLHRTRVLPSHLGSQRNRPKSLVWWHKDVPAKNFIQAGFRSVNTPGFPRLTICKLNKEDRIGTAGLTLCY